ncbi:hypothetical protein LV82_00802 [Albidovulum inexpectatum]|uniref:Uncharacterized protein n=1 Tax=Albidovulum inexpectatum TaxID=196587 RepID=A0A2S5JJG7_9RHOB|nr:hypothetical protein LV82_00802 [Albidovulum inexpectatum]
MLRLCLMIVLLVCATPTLAGASPLAGTHGWQCAQHRQTHGACAPAPCGPGQTCPSMAQCANAVLPALPLGLPERMTGVTLRLGAPTDLRPLAGPETDKPPPRS